MVYRDAERLIFLTKEGEYQAISALDKVAIIQKFLTDVLGVKHEIANTDACSMSGLTRLFHVNIAGQIYAFININHKSSFVGERHL